jgi:hypothetical protein
LGTFEEKYGPISGLSPFAPNETMK